MWRPPSLFCLERKRKGSFFIISPIKPFQFHNFKRDHLQSILAIICGLGIICGTVSTKLISWMLDRMIDLHNRDCISCGYKHLFLQEVSQRLIRFLLVKRTLGWKNIAPENFLEINRFFALTSYCNTIDQSNNAFSILGFSLAGKRSDRVFFTFFFSSFHPLADKTNNDHLSKPFFKVIRKSLYQGLL